MKRRLVAANLGHGEVKRSRIRDESDQGADIASYFRRRAAKLEEQTASSAKKPLIFAGCVFYVNTCAKDGLRLRQLIAEYGGSPWIMGPAVSVITHIVAGSLTPAKVHSLIQRIGTKAVHAVIPAYIYACVEAGRRLPEARFLCVSDANQAKLGAAAKSISESRLSSAVHDAGHGAEASACKRMDLHEGGAAGAKCRLVKKKLRCVAGTTSRSWSKLAVKLPSPNALCAKSNSRAAVAGTRLSGHVPPAGAAPITFDVSLKAR